MSNQLHNKLKIVLFSFLPYCLWLIFLQESSNAMISLKERLIMIISLFFGPVASLILIPWEFNVFNGISYMNIFFLITMLLMLSIGWHFFNRAIAYKLLLILGILIWFYYGLLAAGYFLAPAWI